MSNSDLIEICYCKSLELLKNNSCEFGFLASAPQKKAVERNYLSVFSRDASICSLGALASRDKQLINTAKKSLLTLVRKQASNGQIPNYVKPGSKRVDFWRLGCIDATLWWLITLKYYDKYSGDKQLFIKLKKKADKACFWLECQTHVEDGLVMQGEASDWADIMPYSGKVLYSNSLWYEVKRLYKLGQIMKAKENFNNLFYPFNNDRKKVIAKCGRTTVEQILKTEKETEYYLSYVGYMYWGKTINVYANSLAIFFNLPDIELKNKIVNKILSEKRKKDLPMPVLFNPIKQHSREWRKYMESYNQNFPNQYHNGGVWPFAACFWAVALAKAGRKEESLLELKRIAEANKRNNWQFNEWFHAKNGKSSGMRKQSWNAGMFIFAYKYLNGEFKL